MAKVLYEKDIQKEVLQGKKITVIGYGSQGHGHALNLRDSGFDVTIGLRPGKSQQKAEDDGFTVLPVADAVKQADGVVVLLPDEQQAIVYQESIKDNLKDGGALVFDHGFNIYFSQLVPQGHVDVLLAAPKGLGHLVSRTFEEGAGVPALYGLFQDDTGKATEVALAYVAGIGAARAGVRETSFQEETETDLFGEQTVLCGGLSGL